MIFFEYSQYMVDIREVPAMLCMIESGRSLNYWMFRAEKVYEIIDGTLYVIKDRYMEFIVPTTISEEDAIMLQLKATLVR